VSPTRYSIERLLSHGIQMFEDLDDDELAALGAGIGKKGRLLDPVTVTADGILVDGHQRLRAMLGQGRAMIDAVDVRVIEATATDALEVSIRLNVARRHLSVEQKANLARRLQHERGWSQGKIAELFGVSRPAVNQWLNKPDTAAELAEMLPQNRVRGTDGKEYPAAIKEKAPVHPWRPTEGHAFKALHKLKLVLEHEESVSGLNPLQAAKVAQECQDVIASLEAVVEELNELVLPPSYARK
jgi:predicted XRE-type DNA-binding protein